MPKIKTKSGAKKRFKVTAGGKVLYAHRGKRHGMIKRTKKQIRQLRGTAVLFKTDGDNIKNTSCPTAHRPSAVRRPPPQRSSAPNPGDQPWHASSAASPHAKHKKILKAAKGYYGRRKNTIRIAKQAVEKANQYAFRDRKRRKRTFRALSIQRLNAAVRRSA